MASLGDENKAKRPQLCDGTSKSPFGMPGVWVSRKILLRPRAAALCLGTKMADDEQVLLR
jgi:hypothetical protein